MAGKKKNVFSKSAKKKFETFQTIRANKKSKSLKNEKLRILKSKEFYKLRILKRLEF